MTGVLRPRIGRAFTLPVVSAVTGRPENRCQVVDYKPDACWQTTCTARASPYGVLANLSRRRMTSPTMLFGVDAPAVRPTVRAADVLSQPRSTVSRPLTVD